MKKVLVFGIFDKLHPGHKEFLRRARAHGTTLVAVVASDAEIKAYKGRFPMGDFYARVDALMASKLVDKAVSGDKERGTWGVLAKHMPQVIALGHDQKELYTNLRKFLKGKKEKPEVVFIEAYHPEKYASGGAHKKVIKK